MITLPAFFSDGMVMGKRARVWGNAPPGQEVAASFLGKAYETVAGADGRFSFIIEAPDYGGPFTLTVGGRVINDVYVGRLWFCGGQSNMEMPLGRARQLLGRDIKDDRRIRAFQVAKDVRFDGPAEDVQGKWHEAAGDFLEHLYAVPYFFARALLKEDGDVPIGLLNVAAGGTAIEGWLPEEIVGEYPDLHEKLETVRAPGYIERLQREADEAARTWHEELGRKDAGVAEGWHSPDYIYENPAAEPGDNDGWHNRLLLDNTGFTHGTVWFRKKVNLEEVPHGPVTLDLGRAADSVAVYVNGTLVKSVDYQYPPCLCELPSGMLKKGENIIAIRLTGSGQKPGFVPGKKYALSYPGGRIDLSGYWKCRVGAEMPAFLGWPWFYGHPCCVYNHMLAPVLGVMVDGVIWYQGESNTYNPPMYRELFTRFVELLRLSLGGDCPVIFTQLANYLDFGGTGENWAALREQQRLCLSIPNTAMAVAIDCGEYNDLHPLDKKSVGERLALHALRMVYGHDIVTNGPVVSHVTQQDGRFTVHFRNARGLWAKNGRPVVELVTDGFDDEIHRLYASVEGETLVVDANVLRGAVKVPRVVRVRFGWTDNPPVTLYNAHNLPASPFEISVEA